jgi:hypothetical protein
VLRIAVEPVLATKTTISLNGVSYFMPPNKFELFYLVHSIFRLINVI